MGLPLATRLKPSQLRLVRSIHDTGKLQLAAEAVNMTQPSASRLLADIEAEVGGALFDRQPRGMTATALGEAFVRHAQVILAELESLAAEVGSLQSGKAGGVRVGSVTGPAVSALLPALMKVRRIAPDIQPTIEVAPSAELMRGLEEGRFDFIIARISPDSDARAYQAYPGRTEEVAFLVREGHPLAGGRVSLQAALEYDFLIQEPGSPIRLAFEQAFLENRIAMPERITNSSSLLIALSLVGQSDTIATQTHEVAQMLSGIGTGLTTLDLDTAISVPPFLVIHARKRKLTSVAQRLLDEVLRHL
ncbi:LysR family transcriptional regulator [Phaeobacter sp. B1627]|uniref:LysR family transcriptional regulator n=1 Tax=Phaeobacter sp. B1627 TaxID=2583809 RepID=UPI00111BB63D|nr:LysR family transcriptional regulator [Phaeobacter sp. B1627]TNJ47776.1 LysR family transcriptional regulator [Phaeobacter sp. B1627]